MVSASLCLHRGARYVERSVLDAIAAPPSTSSWFPLKHSQVLDAVGHALAASGYQVSGAKLGLAQGDHQFFGVLDLSHRLAEGVNLAVGVRNSTNKTFPLGFCAGNRVFVCDNLSFRSELVVKRKHTRFGRERFVAAIGEAVSGLQQFQLTEAERIRSFQATPLPDVDAESLILRGLEQGLVPPRFVLKVLGEWRSPSFPDFRPRTLWSLENEFTSGLREVAQANPTKYAGLTIRLQQLFAAATWIPPSPTPLHAA